MTTIYKYANNADRWNAVTQRDALANGLFVYAVKTTGVFCRPTCSSRQPNRANVEFFATCEQAERCGYRSCKKCKPKLASVAVPDAVSRACQIIKDSVESPKLTALAQAVGLSTFYFHKLFKSVVGVTPKAYAAASRAEKFREALTVEQTVTQAMHTSGFGSSSRCYEKVSDHLGMTPTAYRNGGVGQSMRFAIVECRLGWVAVAATERGVCMIELGDRSDTLQIKCVARFPHASLHDSDDEFRGWVTLVVRQIEMPERVAVLPLDVQGTAFQRKVWEALQAIPVGATATYTEVARKIGQPAAVRAVANACAANQIAVIVPCHRVVRSDGELSGYRWGVERKAELLRMERQNHIDANQPATTARKKKGAGKKPAPRGKDRQRAM